MKRSSSIFSLSMTRIVVLVAGALLLAVTPAQAATPEQACKSGKNKTAGKYAACRENAEAKLVGGGDPSKYSDALDKWESKFSDAWGKLEAKALAASASCPGDDTVIKGKTHAYTSTVSALIGGLGSRFVDNGDGTVTDHETGLQWEQKTTGVGSGQNLADPHDVDNTYTWSAGGNDPDGTAFTQFLATLNAPPCFAGHCDWRLPSEGGRNVPLGLTELESILEVPCGGGACIDADFGPTVASKYWSATTFPFPFPDIAWFVDFNAGFVSLDLKFHGYSVRAVRTGS